MRRTKTLIYRRAVWLGNETRTLEELVRLAHAKVKKVSERRFERSDGQYIKCLKSKPGPSDAVSLHLAAETPGDAASITLKAHDNQEEADVGVTPAPEGSEFMDGDLFARISGNHVFLTSTGLREGTLRFYLCALFKKAKLGDDAEQFELQRAANVSKVAMLKNQGVKEIHLGTTLYDATNKYLDRNGDTVGLLNTLGHHVRTLFGTQAKYVEDQLSVGIVIKADGRFKKNRVMTDSGLKNLASDLLKDGDDYVIVTKTGQRISQSEIFVSQKVEIKRIGKSVDCSGAWDALKQFHLSLESSGITAQ